MVVLIYERSKFSAFNQLADLFQALVFAWQFLSTSISPREDPSGILDKWIAYGTCKNIVDKIEKYVPGAANSFSIRFVAWDQITQLKRFSEEVLPNF